jgi:hypothetical protein
VIQVQKFVQRLPQGMTNFWIITLAVVPAQDVGSPVALVSQRNVNNIVNEVL